MPSSPHTATLRNFGVFLIGLAAGIAGMTIWHPSADNDVASTDPATNPLALVGQASRRSVVALGTIEPRDGVVQIGSPLVGYRIQQVLAVEGQAVKEGELLIELDAAPAKAELDLVLSQQADAQDNQQAQIELARQRLATAELAVKQAEAGRDLELAAQRSQVSVAAARKKQTQRDLERYTELQKLPEPLATAQQVDQQQLLLDSAAAQLDAAEAATKRFEQSLTFQQQTTAAELKAAQQSLALAEKGTGVDSLARQVEIAELKLRQTKIASPITGIVLGVHTHPGEVVPQQPLLQIANLDRLVCVAEVEVGDVAELQPGQKAAIRCRAFPGVALEGTIDRVGNQAAPAGLRPLDPRQPVDRDITRVVVLLDSKKAAKLMNLSGRDRRAALVGLQVEVSFPLAERDARLR
jgi:ABC exporter DevB family membrane fusion protein